METKLSPALHDSLADLEYHIDYLVMGNARRPINISAWFRRNHITERRDAAYLVRRYGHLLEEYSGALKGDDPQLKEAYSHVSKKNLKKVVEFLTVLVGEARSVRKSATKPRKTKKKEPSQLVKKMLYQKRDEKLKLTSIDPEDVIGAAQLWTYNTKTRHLGYIKAATKAGLSVKGCALTNVGVAKHKTIRKPDITLPKVLIGTEPNKVFDALSTVAKDFKPRTGRTVLLLRTSRAL